jgi:hypothetical protein
MIAFPQHQWEMDGCAQSTEEITVTNKTKVFGEKPVPYKFHMKWFGIEPRLLR